MKVSVIASASAMALFMGNAAGAQEQLADQSDESLTDIVVTAQRREERLQDVPISTTITTGADLERSNIVGLQDLATRLPNVKISEGTVDSLNIRGVGSGQNAGFEQAVGTFVDGVYRGRARAVRGALFDIERVEVLKGPQTTYFGNNAVAGALNVTTRKPGEVFDYNASALYGWNLGEYAVEGGVTTPINERLSMRFAARAYGMDGFIENEALSRDEPRGRNWIGRASLLFEPNDIWRADLRVDRAKSNRDGDGGQLLKCPPDPEYNGGAPSPLCAQQLAVTGSFPEQGLDFSSFSAVDTYENYDLTEVAATNRISLGAHTLTSITSYFEHEDELVPTIGPFAFPGVGGTANAVTASFNEDYHQFAQELRIDSPGGETFDYMFGAYYARGELDQPSFFGFFFAPFGLFAGAPYTADTPVAANISFAQDDETLSGFTAGTWNVSEVFKVNAGLRYSVVEKTAHSFTRFGQGSAPVNEGTFIEGPASVNANLAPLFAGDLGDFPDATRRDSKLMPSLGAQYNFTPDVMSYLSWASGFKAGGFGVGFQRDTFAPETADSYEVGLKASLLNRRLFISLAGFLGKYDNLQETTNFSQPSGIPIAVITNVAAAESKGAELSLNWKASRSLAINADLAYLDATYENYPNAPCTVLQGAAPNCTQDLSGKVRAYAPEFSGNLGARLTLPLSSSLEAHIDPSVYFTSEFYQIATIDPLLKQPGYTKFDLRLAVAPFDGRWEFALIGKNLTDKATASYRNTPPGSFGTIYALPDPSRAVAVQVSFSP